jgi:hypothetical protein
MIDDLPAIVMSNYGEAGALTVNNLVTRHKYDKHWRRSDCKWLKRSADFAANALQCNPELSANMKSHFEVIVFVAWLFDAVRSQRTWKARQYVPRT